MYVCDTQIFQIVNTCRMNAVAVDSGACFGKGKVFAFIGHT